MFKTYLFDLHAKLYAKLADTAVLHGNTSNLCLLSTFFLYFLKCVKRCYYHRFYMTGKDQIMIISLYFIVTGQTVNLN